MKKLITLLLIVFLVSAIGHAIVLPQVTNCILIDFYDFEDEGALYFEAGFSEEKKMEVRNLIQEAEAKVASFWGEKTSHPKFIFCCTEETYTKFGSGTREEIMMNYRVAKYKVAQWYNPEVLENFVAKINRGSSFNISSQIFSLFSTTNTS